MLFFDAIRQFSWFVLSILSLFYLRKIVLLTSKIVNKFFLEDEDNLVIEAESIVIEQSKNIADYIEEEKDGNEKI